MCGQTLPFIVIANCAIQQQYNTIQYDVPGISMTHRDSWLQCRDRDPTTASRELQTATHITYSLLSFIAVVPRQISRLLLNWPYGSFHLKLTTAIRVTIFNLLETVLGCWNDQMLYQNGGWWMMHFQEPGIFNTEFKHFQGFLKTAMNLAHTVFSCRMDCKRLFSPRDKTQSAVFCESR